MTQDKVLFLGPDDSPLLLWLRDRGETVFQTAAKLTPAFIDEQGFGFLVSYGYRHILRKEILEKFPDRAINLHISYLPWNRGADPNFWSFVDDTPKGVTIHHLDEGVDTGDIIARKEVFFDPDAETLASSYETLQKEVQQLFQQHWADIRRGGAPRTPQSGSGSTHRVKDKARWVDLLPDGWNTRVSELRRLVAARRRSPGFGA